MINDTPILTSEQLRKDFHYFYPNELIELKALVRELPPDPIVVNIGAGAGTSGLAILESRNDVTLITIDIEDKDSPLGSLFSELDVMRRAKLDHLANVRWFQICNDSKIVGREWTTQTVIDHDKVDMVFVDGAHQYDECCGDIEAWLPHIEPGGIIAVHDYNKEMLPRTDDGPHWRAWPGVNRAVDDLLRGKYELIAFVESLIAFRV